LNGMQLHLQHFRNHFHASQVQVSFSWTLVAMILSSWPLPAALAQVLAVWLVLSRKEIWWFTLQREKARSLLMVLDNNGLLLAWKWSDRVIPIQTTALEFAEDLAAGRWVAARSKFSLQFQEELEPGDLQRKWTKLARTSGGFQAVKDAVIADQGGEQQLVLVTVDFADVTTNLFVIFDRSGRIINVDISRDFV